MFRNVHLDNLRQRFADQFTAEDPKVFYRKNGTGPAYRISQAERDQFVFNYGRDTGRAMWVFLAAFIVLEILSVLLLPQTDDTLIYVQILVILAVTTVPVLLYFQRAWNAPMRALAGRAAEAEALSREDARKLGLAKLGYGQLAFVGAAGALLIWSKSSETDILHGWGASWLILGSAMIGIAAVQAFRKWQSSR